MIIDIKLYLVKMLMCTTLVSATRHSSRLAERKMKSASGTGSEECDLVTPSLCRRGIHENKTSQGPPPPPPPPPPPLPAIHDSAVRNVMPLKERNVNQVGHISALLHMVAVLSSVTMVAVLDNPSQLAPKC